MFHEEIKEYLPTKNYEELAKFFDLSYSSTYRIFGKKILPSKKQFEKIIKKLLISDGEKLKLKIIWALERSKIFTTQEIMRIKDETI